MDPISVVMVCPESDPHLFYETLKLRYEVYCSERGFERPEDHPHGLETDCYDGHAIHLAAVKSDTGEVVGTARIIRHSFLGFPIERHFKIDKDLSHVQRERIGEISRLAIPKRYSCDYEIFNEIFKQLCLASRELGLTHWYAAMAKGLPALLKKRRIIFQPVGPEIDFHGVRAPYFGSIEQIVAQNEFLGFFAGEACVA